MIPKQCEVRKKRKKSDDWKYNDDDSSSESEEDEDREIPPPSKRVGTKRKPVKRSTKTQFSSEDSSVESDEDKRRLATRRSATSVSYKESSEEKTDSEDLVEVDYGEEAEADAEEKCDVIEKVLAQRRGKKGGL